MTLYQLFVEGSLALFDGKYKFHSKVIYRTKEEAISRMPEFAKKCTTRQDANDLVYLENVTRSGVVELTLEE